MRKSGVAESAKSVSSLLKESDEFCDEVEKCFDESLDECNLLKTHRCECCNKVCN